MEYIKTHKTNLFGGKCFNPTGIRTFSKHLSICEFMELIKFEKTM